MKKIRSESIKNQYCQFLILFITFILLLVGGVGAGRASNGDTTILYLVTSQSSTSYFAEYGISVEQGTQTMIRLIPDTGSAEVVDTNYSPSYAKSTIRPYTVDGRFFVFQSWSPSEYTGHHNFTEFDPITNNHILSFRVNDPARTYCYAIIDNHYYYRESRVYDFMSRGYLGGDFKHLQFENGTSGTGDFLLDNNDTENCKGNLHAVNGKLYDAYQDNNQLEVYSRDLTTGKIAETLGSFTVSDSDQYYNRYDFAFDDDSVYWARRRKSDNQIEIWRYDFINQPEFVYGGVTNNIDAIHFFDVDKGQIALGDQDGYVLLFDYTKNEYSVIDIGFSFYDLQIMSKQIAENDSDGTANQEETGGGESSTPVATSSDGGSSGGGGCTMSSPEHGNKDTLIFVMGIFVVGLFLRRKMKVH